jgi:hypothetical protein
MTRDYTTNLPVPEGKPGHRHSHRPGGFSPQHALSQPDCLGAGSAQHRKFVLGPTTFRAHPESEARGPLGRPRAPRRNSPP